MSLRRPSNVFRSYMYHAKLLNEYYRLRRQNVGISNRFNLIHPFITHRRHRAIEDCIDNREKTIVDEFHSRQKTGSL